MNFILNMNCLTLSFLSWKQFFASPHSSFHEETSPFLKSFFLFPFFSFPFFPISILRAQLNTATFVEHILHLSRSSKLQRIGDCFAKSVSTQGFQPLVLQSLLGIHFPGLHSSSFLFPVAVSKAVIVSLKNGTGYFIIYVPYGFAAFVLHLFGNDCRG